MDALCEITSSKRIFAADYVAEGVPFYRGKEITEKYKGNLDVSTELFITEEKFVEIERKFGAPVEGDLLLTSVGTLGSPYVVKAGERFYFKDGNLTWFRRFKELDSGFLYHWLVSPQGKAELQKCTIGSSQSAFTIVLLKSIEIELPDILEQRRIAGVLSAYDELIANNQRRIAVLEEMARALYREWFVYFRAPGVVMKEGNEVPNGWEVKRLSELVTTQYGYTESTQQHPIGPKYLRGMDINKASYINWSEVPYCPINEQDYKSYRLSKGDVLVIRMADPGKVGIVEEDVDAVFASYLIRLRPNSDRLTPYFLFHVMDAPEYQDFVSGASTGTTRQSASAGVLTDYSIALPPKQLVVDFTKRIEPIRTFITTLLHQSTNLRLTRDLLLPRLMSGRVELAAAELTLP